MTHRKPRRISGKLVILALLLTVAILPLPVYLTLQWARRSLAITDTPMDWSDRANWPTPPVKHTTLEVPISNYAPTGSGPKWKTTEFVLHPREEKITKQCAYLARLPREAFGDEAVRDQLEQWVSQYPTLFYPRYVLAQWYRLSGHNTKADELLQQAMADTPAVLILPYRDTTGQATANLNIGTIEIALDRADGRSIDQTLKLVYPHQSTDNLGRVYLPVYQTFLRFAELPTPVGFEVRYRDYLWFEFPGRVAMLRPAVVRPRK